VSEAIAELEGGRAAGASRGRLDRLTRSLVHGRLARLRRGRLTLVEAGEAHSFGDPHAELHATIYVRSPSFYRAVAARGALGGAEAYMDGAWSADDLVAVVRILALDRHALSRLDGSGARLARPALRLLHALRRNTREGSRRNIAAHYDLGNEFFELFLDPTLTYSCGVFERPDASMEEASIAKYERVCRKLGIGPGDRVLEIGTGWGGFALHAAGRHGCRVTSATISRRQLEGARLRVAAAGLGGRVEVRLEDYRDLRGRFDALVSIEMIEAVGHRNFDAYFRACSERLQPDGAMLLQAITVSDRDFEASTRSVDFIKRHVFPGGQLASIGAVCASVARATDLRLTHLEDLSAHYVETLRRWRARMLENLDAMRALGHSDRFLRMWEFYLCYCEGAFQEREIGVVQLVLEKPASRRAWRSEADVVEGPERDEREGAHQMPQRVHREERVDDLLVARGRQQQPAEEEPEHEAEERPRSRRNRAAAEVEEAGDDEGERDQPGLPGMEATPLAERDQIAALRRGELVVEVPGDAGDHGEGQ
jgi:cyclopropane-fatty-acyl-phospholipid synthase